jgi:hypothetical protein
MDMNNIEDLDHVHQLVANNFRGMMEKATLRCLQASSRLVRINRG